MHYFYSQVSSQNWCPSYTSLVLYRVIHVEQNPHISLYFKPNKVTSHHALEVTLSEFHKLWQNVKICGGGYCSFTVTMYVFRSIWITLYIDLVDYTGWLFHKFEYFVMRFLETHWTLYSWSSVLCLVTIETRRHCNKFCALTD